MSQTTYVCDTNGCPHEGRLTRARRCAGCDRRKRPQRTSDWPNAEQRQSGIPVNNVVVVHPAGTFRRRRAAWSPAVAAGIGALTSIGLRLLLVNLSRTRARRPDDR